MRRTRNLISLISSWHSRSAHMSTKLDCAHLASLRWPSLVRTLPKKFVDRCVSHRLYALSMAKRSLPLPLANSSNLVYEAIGLLAVGLYTDRVQFRAAASDHLPSE